MKTSSSPSSSSPSTNISCDIEIPVEFVSEEEMAFIEAALASARPLLTSSSSSSSSSAVAASYSFSTTSGSRFALLSALPSVLSPRRRHASSLHSAAPSAAVPDIEDSVGSSPPRSLLRQFRSRRALMVTDITTTEWCEKQMEFILLRGKPQMTEAMKAGSNRHFELEKEVVEKVEIHIKSAEDSWAVRFVNFIVGTNYLRLDGLTRELLVVGVVEGVWMTGVIDEIRMSDKDSLNPLLVDTKTRYKATLPLEAQKRNSRLQLMCYKYLWDNLVAGNFPTDHFCSHFELNPQYILSENVQQYTTSLGLHVKTFGDVVAHFRDACCLISPSQDQLLLRYELQSDRSLLEEYWFAYDAGWFENQIKEGLRFWTGEREAGYVSDSEGWKCRFCAFTAACPKTSTSNSRA